LLDIFAQTNQNIFIHLSRVNHSEGMRKNMAAQERKVWRNGKMILWEKATVHLMSHSLTRGSAVFEVLAVYPTSRGPAAFRLPEHCDRLFRSAELLGMEIVQSKEEIIQAVVKTVRVNRISQGFVKIVGYYSEETFSISVSNPRLELSIFAISAEEFRKHATSSISVCLSRWRKLHPETVPVEAKVAANYLNGMLARQDAQRRGFDLGVMLDTHGFLAESSVESVFIVKDGVLMTPPLGLILSSISRRSVLEAAPTAGIKVAERPIRRQEVLEADELFTSSTSRRVMPISRIEDRVLKEAPGPVTRKLLTLIDAICNGKEKRYKHWLQPIK
jgi:branched-chain amino acid aminotransferase